MLYLPKKVQALLVPIVLVLSASASQVFATESRPVDMKAQVQEVQAQINDLVEQGGKYVYLQIARKNGLSPFAVGRQLDGSVIMLEVPKSEEQATLQDKVLKLRQMLKLGAESGKFLAAALFVQAKVPYKGEDVDGVAIEMEHKLGISVLRFLPYEVDRQNKKIKFDKPVDKQKPIVFYKAEIAQTASAKKNNKELKLVAWEAATQ